MTYPEINCAKRTNESFRNKIQEEHHVCQSILENLPIDMVNDFALDYLHLICLGVVKKLILFWLNGSKIYHTKLLPIDKKRNLCRTDATQVISTKH